jgi:hypothetical protein
MPVQRNGLVRSEPWADHQVSDRGAKIIRVELQLAFGAAPRQPKALPSQNREVESYSLKELSIRHFPSRLNKDGLITL